MILLWKWEPKITKSADDSSLNFSSNHTRSNFPVPAFWKLELVQINIWSMRKMNPSECKDWTCNITSGIMSYEVYLWFSCNACWSTNETRRFSIKAIQFLIFEVAINHIILPKMRYFEHFYPSLPNFAFQARLWHFRAQKLLSLTLQDRSVTPLQISTRKTFKIQCNQSF